MIYSKFKKLMTDFLSIRKDEDNLQKAFQKFEPDWGSIAFCRYEDLVMRSLKAAMNDENDWISYWVYDCECGKRDMGVESKDGKKIPFKTIRDLYNMLTDKNL